MPSRSSHWKQRLGRSLTSWCIPVREVDRNENVPLSQGQDQAHQGDRKRGLSLRSYVPAEKTRLDYAEQFDPCDCSCTNSRPGNFPFFTLLLCLSHIAIYIYYVAIDPEHNIIGLNTPILCSQFIYSPYHREQVWRYFTYSFTHSGLSHLIGNLTIQTIIGMLLEMVHGTPPVLAIFIIGATSGGLMTGIMSPDKLVIGASGGDYALVFAYLGNLLLNWDSMKGLWKWLRLVFLVLFIGADIYNAVTRQMSGQISSGAHLGGAIAGLGVGMILLCNFCPTKKERILRNIVFGLTVLAFVVGVFWTIFWPGFKEFDDAAPPCQTFGHCVQYKDNCAT